MPLASLLLLEVVLQIGALLVDPAARPVAPAGDGPTILAVGDSWVAGAEAAPGQGFVDVLAGAWRDDGVTLVNRGRSGANSAHVALTVLDEAPALRPALILVLVGQNNATNRYRVAEVEQRLAERAGHVAPEAPGVQLRTVKLARILWANLRGTEGYTVDPPRPLPSIRPLQEDNEGRPILGEPLLEAGPGRQYLERQIHEAPTPTGDPIADAAWQLLFAAARRTVDPGPEPALLVSAVGPHALLARYALLRRARELGEWGAVRRHGLALAELPRGALRDLGAAEGALLLGDWRTARALLASASNQAPGFADVVDMACRFPAEAADRAVQEACEFPLWGEPTALDRARVADGTLDPEGAAAAHRAWLDQRPDDLATRVDLAAWMAQAGDLAEADALMGLPAGGGPPPEPVRPEADHWRYYVLRSAEPGDRQAALEAVERALADQAQAPPDAALLGAVTAVLADYRACATLPPVADRWYRARGDASGYGRAMQRCMSPADVVTRLAGLRPPDAPEQPADLVAALGRSAGEPFALLHRDLDLVLETATAIQARVLLLDYPNPSDDHGVLAGVLAEYAASRSVERVGLRAAFADRLTPDQWAAHLGPNGHCNAQGYALMAELIAEHIDRTAMLP